MAYRYAVFARFPDSQQARSFRDTLPESRLPDVKVRLFDCATDECAPGILAGLMNNSTWAESDGRRGLWIGVGLGALMGPSFGYLLFYLLEMPTGIGVLIGGMMGTMIGALMSGIIGAGLVHPRLKQIVNRLETGQAVLSISSRSRSECERAEGMLRSCCLEAQASR